MKRLLSFIAAAVFVGCCQGCDQGYEQVGDACLAFHLGSAYNWTEADVVCSEQYGGVLAKVTSASDLRAIYEYIITYGLTDSFWLGGSDLLAEGDWVWLADSSRVSKATPFWALANGLFGYIHEPSGGQEENCLLLDKKKKYFFNDEDCGAYHHLICMQM
ncbi:perlucin-like protein [Scylla paramamosain]|uniref:perlucin-like protein n=1 Tax=Scylla paramamosain TaxID=85552 RepID=UPI0030828629